MKPRPRSAKWSRYLAGLVQSAPLPQTADDAAKLLHAAGMFSIAENLADLTALLREAFENDLSKEEDHQKQMAGGAK
jgi:hypothetical protein